MCVCVCVSVCVCVLLKDSDWPHILPLWLRAYLEDTHVPVSELTEKVFAHLFTKSTYFQMLIHPSLPVLPLCFHLLSSQILNFSIWLDSRMTNKIEWIQIPAASGSTRSGVFLSFRHSELHQWCWGRLSNVALQSNTIWVFFLNHGYCWCSTILLFGMLHCITPPPILQYMYTLCQTLNHFNILLHYYNVNDKEPKVIKDGLYFAWISQKSLYLEWPSHNMATFEFQDPLWHFQSTSCPVPWSFQNVPPLHRATTRVISQNLRAVSCSAACWQS